VEGAASDWTWKGADFPSLTAIPVTNLDHVEYTSSPLVSLTLPHIVQLLTCATLGYVEARDSFKPYISHLTAWPLG